MKLRHTIVFATVGWYLMAPPVAQWSPLVIETQKPLSQWETFQSFDTAEQCKAAQHKMGTFLDSAISSHLKEIATHKDRANDPNLWMLRSEQGKVNLSKCVASDDPRLAK